MACQRIHIAHRNRLRHDAQAVQKLPRCGAPAPQVQRQDGAKAPHLLRGHTVARMRGQAGVVHTGHCRLGLQPPGQCLGIGTGGLHTQWQRLEPAQQHDSFVRTQAPAQLPHASRPDGPQQFGAAHGDAPRGVAVPADELGGRVHNHIHPQRQRAREVGRRKRVVGHADGPCLARNLRHLRQVHHLQGGVAGRFNINDAGASIQPRPQGVHRAKVPHRDTQPRQQRTHHPVGAAIQGAHAGDHIARLEQAQQAGADGRHAAGKPHRGLAALQCCHLALEGCHRGVGKPAVNIAWCFAIEAPLARLKIVVGKRRRGHDGGRYGAGAGVGRLPGMNGQGAKSPRFAWRFMGWDVGAHQEKLRR